jgi:hypothetical protein
MGLFDWLQGEKSNVEVAVDRIWLTKAAKLAGISSDVAQSLADPGGPLIVLLVAHFSDSAGEVQELVERAGFDQRNVLSVMANDLAGFSTRLVEFGESQWVEIVVAERHPLASHDDSLIAFARTLPCRCRIVFHVSLDEPLMRIFAGDWLKQVLERLGMEENEAIESRMVSRRIQDAQKKIAQRATGDVPAESCEAWFERNCAAG